MACGRTKAQLPDQQFSATHEIGLFQSNQCSNFAVPRWLLVPGAKFRFGVGFGLVRSACTSEPESDSEHPVRFFVCLRDFGETRAFGSGHEPGKETRRVVLGFRSGLKFRLEPTARLEQPATTFLRCWLSSARPKDCARPKLPAPAMADQK